MAQQKNLLEVDWSKIPAPEDDGLAGHLAGSMAPSIALAATNGTSIDLSRVGGKVVVFAYPRTGEPGKIGLTDDWDMIPGARGCTPQTCAFRDLNNDFSNLGARVFGLSTQSAAYQREMVERLHVPFPVLSDEALTLARAWRLPTMEVAGMTLLKRLALVLVEGRVDKVFYPVFPPDRNAADVLAYFSRPAL
ncbi:peroxiredoxin [Candidatus Raskinella chloraquaticus]|uniref:BcpB protein n=1 Tax=Candidatus Raskinella chloraquaticus TaxID=1951219 RepID=A0A1W9HTH8_9HYPH|nr:MAG: BcpB protein [Proteobacteria bacterium SG_bin8]